MVTGSRGDLRVSGPRWCDATGATLVEPVHAGACGHAGDTCETRTRDVCAFLLNQNVALFICINITVNLLLQHLETTPVCTWLSVYLNLIYHLPHCTLFYPHFLPPLPFLPLFSPLLSPPL